MLALGGALSSKIPVLCIALRDFPQQYTGTSDPSDIVVEKTRHGQYRYFGQ